MWQFLDIKKKHVTFNLCLFDFTKYETHFNKSISFKQNYLNIHFSFVQFFKNITCTPQSEHFKFFSSAFKLGEY